MKKVILVVICSLFLVFNLSAQKDAIQLRAELIDPLSEKGNYHFNFKCLKDQLLVKVTAKNTTSMPQKMYWPDKNDQGPPVLSFDIQMNIGGRILTEEFYASMGRKAKTSYRIIELQANEEITALHYINNMNREELLDFVGGVHHWSERDLNYAAYIPHAPASLFLNYNFFRRGIQDGVWRANDSLLRLKVVDFELENVCDSNFFKPMGTWNDAPVRLLVKILGKQGTYDVRHPEDGYWKIMEPIKYHYTYQALVRRAEKGKPQSSDTVLLILPEGHSLTRFVGAEGIATTLQQSELELLVGRQYQIAAQYNEHSFMGLKYLPLTLVRMPENILPILDTEKPRK